MLEIFDDGRSLLEFQLVRLKKAFPFAPIVVATSTAAADQLIEEIALKNKVLCYRGEEQNVLGRFVNCCHHFHFTDYIIRICGDNPFLQIEFLEALQREGKKEGGHVDYVSYAVNHKPAILTHFGFFAELVRVDALERVDALGTVDGMALAAHYREHVTNYIYLRGDKDYSIRWLEFDLLAPFADSIRLTVDSREDFENAQSVYGALKGVAEPDLSWKSILSVVEGHPATRVNMEKQIRLHQK